jgi:hypothetical protein
VAPAPTTGAPPALSAFLRGTGRRALLFAALQAGEGPAVDAALIRAAARFVAAAEALPMGAWPSRFWGSLVAELPRPGAAGTMPPDLGIPGLQALAAPGSGARTAMLLALVAGLDEDDGGAALGVDAATWRMALRRAAPRDGAGDFDETQWRTLAAALRDAQRDLPDARLAWWEHVAAAALAPRARPAAAAIPDSDPGDAGHRRRAVRLLWIGVGACALALVATFVPWRAWQAGDGDANPAAAAGIPLDAAESPDARYDATFALRHHPDLPRLLAGGDALLRESDFGAWYAARLASGAPESPEPPDARAAADAPEAANAPAAQPAPEPGVAAIEPQPLPAFDALSPAQLVLLRQRADASDALPRSERGALRERWEAWQRLPVAERHAVRAALAAFAALPAEERQALRAEFAALPGDLQRGWLLGPTLGARWPLLQPLLQQVPADEREPLLARLHAMDPAALDAFAAIARRTPPQARDALRREVAGLPRR